MATITAYSNDLSYDDVFIEQLKNFLNPGDLVVAISGSGNSKNIIKAVEYANSKGNRTAGLTGYGGGKLKQIATFSVNANVDDMEISEDIHLMLCHTLKNVFMDLLKDEK
jgi:D-sedoheptulose 7-phosphate isomerase